MVQASDISEWTWVQWTVIGLSILLLIIIITLIIRGGHRRREKRAQNEKAAEELQRLHEDAAKDAFDFLKEHDAKVVE